MNKFTEYYKEQLGKAEKPIWDEASAVFEDLLEDLNSKNLLRKGTLHMDRERLMQIWASSRNYGLALNEMIHKFDSEEKMKEFTSKSGLTEGIMVHLLLSQLVGTALISFESVLKTSLLFFLEEEQGIRRNMTLGRLLNQIMKISPETGQRLLKIVDTEIRNPLAHGTFWFKAKGTEAKVFLASSSYLDDVKEMELYKFWIETKRINIVSLAFVNVLNEKIAAGYFRV